MSLFQNHRSSKFCRQYYLNYKGLLRALSIRQQLKNVLSRFSLPIESCNGKLIRLKIAGIIKLAGCTSVDFTLVLVTTMWPHQNCGGAWHDYVIGQLQFVFWTSTPRRHPVSLLLLLNLYVHSWLPAQLFKVATFVLVMCSISASHSILSM